MTLILDNDEITGLLDMATSMAALESSYRDLAAGNGGTQPRHEIASPSGREGHVYILKSIEGVHPPSRYATLRLNSDIIGWDVHAGSTRRVKVPAASGQRYVGLVLLFSTETGEPLAIFPDGVLQRIRVAATSALGARFMAREESRTVALIGSGWQAGAQAEAIATVRTLRDIRVFSPNPAHRQAFARTTEERLKLPVTPCESLESALEGADIVLCATNALDPLIRLHHLRPGVHYSSIKPAEIATDAVHACDRVAVHLRDNAPRIVRTRGVILEEDRKQALAPDRDLGEDSFPELADLLTGHASGRQTADETTCFLNYSGTGYQFTAIAGLLYDKARSAGIGRDIPTDWLTEREHP